MMHTKPRASKNEIRCKNNMLKENAQIGIADRIAKGLTLRNSKRCVSGPSEPQPSNHDANQTTLQLSYASKQELLKDGLNDVATETIPKCRQQLVLWQHAV